MKRDYKNLIFTDHALQQMKKRRIKHRMVYEAIKKPDTQEPEEDDKVRFTRVIDERDLHVVASFVPTQDKWMVVTAWVRGEEDPRPFTIVLLLLPFRILRLLWRIFRFVLKNIVWRLLRGLWRLIRRGKKTAPMPAESISQSDLDAPSP